MQVVDTFFCKKKIGMQYGDICSEHRGTIQFSGWQCEVEIDFDHDEIRGYGEMMVCVEIEYCPFCGKRLKEIEVGE